MLDHKSFDLWSSTYDKTVNLSEESNTYPFAAYRNVLSAIYTNIKHSQTAKILDIGFGTAVLSKKLYDEGYEINGIDFSAQMLLTAQIKMPHARLIQYDFTDGLPEAFENEKFDYIICTYAIHHMDDDAKLRFISQLLERINKGGKLFIGDVAFETHEALEKCRSENQDIWDNDEIYPVLEVFARHFKNVSFVKMSFCSGVFTFTV